jgi:hypothetical protein
MSLAEDNASHTWRDVTVQKHVFVGAPVDQHHQSRQGPDEGRNLKFGNEITAKDAYNWTQVAWL